MFRMVLLNKSRPIKKTQEMLKLRQTSLYLPLPIHRTMVLGSTVSNPADLVEPTMKPDLACLWSK